MKNKLLLSTILILASLASAEPAGALTFRGGAPRVNNQQFLLDQEVVVPVSFSINHKGNALDYFITFSSGNAPGGTNRYLVEPSGSFMYYNLHDDEVSRNILLDLTDGPGTENVISGSFTQAEASKGGGTTREISFVFIIDQNQFPLAGSYSDTVILSLYEGTLSSPAPGGPVGTTNMSISTRMDAITEISLVPEGTTFDPASTMLSLDFGILLPGNSRSADLLVRSNSSYSLSLQSVNGGTMVIQDPTDTSIVPYTLTSNGISLNLAPGTQSIITTGAAPTTGSWDRYAIGVSINEYGVATEGLYSDTITFTLSAP